jgi:hypothetical protein
LPDTQRQSGAGSSAAGDATAPTVDSLSRLYHMSTTAGAGTQDYVAINATAVGALVLGLGSVLALLSNVMLAIPVAGVICAVVAIGQIRRSNQTQTGLALAVTGMVLSIALGGGRGTYQVVRKFHVTSDERQIAALMNKLGQDISAGKDDEAYHLFSERFRDRISQATFETAFNGLRRLPTSGTIQSINWNGEPMLMEDQPGNDVTVASAMAFFKFEKDPAPRRSVIVFEKAGGGEWRVSDIEAIFKRAPK